jgi:hypothetical protein
MITYDDGVSGQFFVKLKDDVSVITEARQLASDYGGEVLHTYEPLFNGFSVEGIQTDNAVRLERDERVQRVEQDRSFVPPPRPTNTEIFFSQLRFSVRNFGSVANNWALDRIDQEDMPLNHVLTRSNFGDGVHVYVVDSGINDSGQRLFGARLEAGISFINGGGTSDCANHGTSVAAIIGSNDLGVAPQVRIHPVRVWCGPNSSLAPVAAGVKWAAMQTQNPAVANISLAFPFSESLNDIVAAAATRIPIVVAAGNRVGQLGPFDVSTVSPASVGDVITVAGSTLSLGHDARWRASNFGSGVDLFAPAEAIFTYSANAVPGVTLGTSFSSGLVCGAVAIYLNANPGATPAGVRNAIINASTKGKVSGRKGEPDRLLRLV